MATQKHAGAADRALHDWIDGYFADQQAATPNTALGEFSRLIALLYATAACSAKWPALLSSVTQTLTPGLDTGNPGRLDALLEISESAAGELGKIDTFRMTGDAARHCLHTLFEQHFRLALEIHRQVESIVDSPPIVFSAIEKWR